MSKKDKCDDLLIKYYFRAGKRPGWRVFVCLDATRRKVEMVRQCCDVLASQDDTSDEGMVLSGVVLVLNDMTYELLEAMDALRHELEKDEEDIN